MDSGATPTGAAQRLAVVPSETIKTYLSLQDRTALIELIMDQVDLDDSLQERLLFKIAGTGSAKGVDVDAIRALIDTITEEGVAAETVTDGFIERLNNMLVALSDLEGDGNAMAVYDLIDYALSGVERILTTFDHRDGKFDEVLLHLQDLHLSVCRAARPDPKSLAHRLFEWRLNPVWDVFYDVMATYLDVLSEEGLAEYRDLAETTWADLPVLKPGDVPPARFGRRFRLAYIVESIARQSGDHEALAKIRQKDLFQPASFLAIAETYLQAHKKELAILWAERGLKEFPDRQDPALNEFLASLRESGDMVDDR